MRITHVITNLAIGGAEGALCSLIEAQSGTGIEHSVISLLSGGALVPRLRSAGAKVIECGLSRSIAAVSGASQVGRVLQATRPDLVQGWMYHGNVAATACKVLSFTSSPLVWGVRQSVTRLRDDIPLTRSLIAGGALFSVPATRIVYNSVAGAVTHERLGYPRRKRALISNSVDCHRFRPRPTARAQVLKNLGLPDDVRLIGRVARFAAMKDFGTLLAAFAQVRAREPRAHLLLVGPGNAPENMELAALLRMHGGCDAIHLCGPRDDVEWLHSAFDVLVSTSRSNEGFSNAVMEAIASGCPVVATNVGNAEDARELGAIVVPPEDVHAIGEAVLQALSLSAEERLAKTELARRQLEGRFGTRTCAESYLSLWRSVLTEHGRPDISYAYGHSRARRLADHPP